MFVGKFRNLYKGVSYFGFVIEMNKKEIEKLKEIIKAEEKIYDFNDYIENYMDDSDLEEILDVDELREYLEGLNEDNDITFTDVIYYSNAIEYLKENDPSLKNSLEIAEEYGYSLTNTNSETLASLLKSQNNLEDYYEFVESVCNECEEMFKDE